MSDWTQDQIDILRALWPIRHSHEIARLLQKTTNAVIGKANRLGLPPIPSEEIKRRQSETHQLRLSL